MRNRFLKYFLCFVIFAVALMATLLAVQADEPATEGTVAENTWIGADKCKMCHNKVEPGEAHGKLVDPSLPEPMRGCEACHGAGSAHMAGTGDKTKIINPARLSADKASEICAKCHLEPRVAQVPAAWKTMNSRYWKNSTHAMKGVSCLGCHTIHSGSPKSLKKPAKELCMGCHSGLVKKDGYTHAMTNASECTSCHNPHGQLRRNMLVKDYPAVCAGCHDPKAASFKTAHSNYPVQDRDCSSCHDPHSSKAKAKLLKEAKHMPFEKKMCGTCHNKPESENPFALVKSEKEVCSSCHPESKVAPKADAQGNALTQHPPVTGGMCSRCHNPHAAEPKSKLIKGHLDENCFLCHSKVAESTMGEYKHEPVKDGNCLKCHKPHTSPNEKLLVKTADDTCQGCHANQMKHTHPIGAKYINPVTRKPMTCTSCHSVHGGKFTHLTLADRDRDLCLMCHKLAM